MDYGKYIIIERNGVDLAVMFDMILSHKDMSCGFNKILSAGFFEVKSNPTEKDPQDIDVSVFGDSVTLQLKARPNVDNKILKKVMRKDWW